MTYEPYEPGTTVRTAVGGGESTRRSGGSGAAGRTVGAVAGLAFAVVVGAVAIASDRNDTGPSEQDGYPGYSDCAASHDETGSLFSDAEWCDLELNGGDGDGSFDEVPYGFDELPRSGGYYP